MQFLAVNWLAVLVAAILNMVVGFLWYGPLFSGVFLRLIGKREEEIEVSPLVYPLGFVMGLVTTYVLAVIIGSAGVTTWWGGAVTGAVVWIAIGASQYHPVRGSTGRPVAAVQFLPARGADHRRCPVRAVAMNRGHTRNRPECPRRIVGHPPT